ncbi:MAG: class I SAM-dependent methyltransferase [Gemmatimonadaceae bacterium]
MAAPTRIHLDRLHTDFREAQKGKASRHAVSDRVRPSVFQYDYLTLSLLSADIHRLVGELPSARAGALALDLGSDKSPYRELLERRGYAVRTLDLTRESGADYAGTAEDTRLPDASFDLVICTQVLEHCENPWKAVREIRRVLRPGGHLIASAPHVWFYHPHPADHWRFTQEGMAHLCREAGLEPLSLLAQGGAITTFLQIVNFLVYGIAGRMGAPMYAGLNLLAGLGDRLVRNQLFCHNFACLARRTDGAGAARA